MSSPGYGCTIEEQQTIVRFFGALFLGITGSAIIFGANCSQVYDYFRRFHRTDRNALKGLVLVIFILDVLHQAFLLHPVYTYMIVDYFDPAALQKPLWTSPAFNLDMTLIDQIVRLTFIHRLWQFSRNLVLVAPIICLSLFIFAVGIYQFVSVISTGAAYQFSNVPWVVYAYFIPTVAADLSIALSLCFYLHRSRTGLIRTDSIITILVIYTISTGMVTSAFALATFISYKVAQDVPVYAVLWAMLSKLYVNALMAGLNSRSILLNGDGGEDRDTSWALNLTTHIQNLGTQGTMQPARISLVRLDNEVVNQV